MNLLYATKQGELLKVIQLIETKGINVNYKDETTWGYGFTSLHEACRNNNIEIINYLLLQGANPNIKSNAGQTPLHFACQNGNIEIIQLLLNYGADSNIQDTKNKSPLDYAKMKKYNNCIRLLENYERERPERERKEQEEKEKIENDERERQLQTLVQDREYVEFERNNALINQLTTDCERLTQENNILTMKLQELQGINNEQQTEIELLRNQILSHDQTITDLRNLISFKNFELSTNNERNFILEERIKNNQETISSLESQLYQLTQELEKINFSEDKLLVDWKNVFSFYNNPSEFICIADGSFISSINLQKYQQSNKFKEFPTKLKMVPSNNLNLITNLTNELNILLQLNELHNKSDQFVVNCLCPHLISPSNQEESENPNIDKNLRLSCLVMECGGPNLRQFLNDKTNATLDITHRVYILKNVVDALDFIHDHHIVHRDLKPENIVCFSFLKEGIMRWKLIDFENSCHEKDTIKLTLSEGFQFTPEYSPPEIFQVLNREIPEIIINHKIDIWSLGMLSLLLFRLCDYWRDAYPHHRQFSFDWVQFFDTHKLNTTIKSLLEEKEINFVSDCLIIKAENRSTARDLLSKSLFSNQLPTNHSFDLNIIKSDTTAIRRSQDLILSHSIEFNEKINTFSEILSSSSSDIRGDLEESYILLSNEIKRSRDESI